nr:calphotin-like [Aegilops tauschii subsp. strangulata]
MTAFPVTTRRPTGTTTAAIAPTPAGQRARGNRMTRTPGPSPALLRLRPPVGMGARPLRACSWMPLPARWPSLRSSDTSSVGMVACPASFPRSPAPSSPIGPLLETVLPTAASLAPELPSPVFAGKAATPAPFPGASLPAVLMGLLCASPPAASLVAIVPAPAAASPLMAPLVAVSPRPVGTPPPPLMPLVERAPLVDAPAPPPTCVTPTSTPTPMLLGCAVPALLLPPAADPGPDGETWVTTPLAAQPPPPRSVAYSRRGRSASSPVTASRRSARLDAARPEGSPTLPIHERAELRAAARNLEPGTLAVPPTASTCYFSALESIPLGHLAKIATDSAVILRGEVAPPLVQIEAIRAREILDGRLAEARAALLSPPAPSIAMQDAIPPPPRRAGGILPLTATELRGRTRSRTAALRAQSASRVLGSSSPSMDA